MSEPISHDTARGLVVTLRFELELAASAWRHPRSGVAALLSEARDISDGEEIFQDLLVKHANDLLDAEAELRDWYGAFRRDGYPGWWLERDTSAMHHLRDRLVSELLTVENPNVEKLKKRFGIPMKLQFDPSIRPFNPFSELVMANEQAIDNSGAYAAASITALVELGYFDALNCLGTRAHWNGTRAKNAGPPVMDSLFADPEAMATFAFADLQLQLTVLAAFDMSELVHTGPGDPPAPNRD